MEEPQEVGGIGAFGGAGREETALPEGGEPPVVGEVPGRSLTPVGASGEQVVGDLGDGPQVVPGVGDPAPRALLGRGPGGGPVGVARFPDAQGGVRLAQAHASLGTVPPYGVGGDGPVDETGLRQEPYGHGELADDPFLVLDGESARPFGERAPGRRPVQHEGFGGGQAEADDPGEHGPELRTPVTPFESDGGLHLALQTPIGARVGQRGGREAVLDDGLPGTPEKRPPHEKPGPLHRPLLLPVPHGEPGGVLPGGEEFQFLVVRVGRQARRTEMVRMPRPEGARRFRGVMRIGGAAGAARAVGIPGTAGITGAIGTAWLVGGGGVVGAPGPLTPAEPLRTAEPLGTTGPLGRIPGVDGKLDVGEPFVGEALVGEAKGARRTGVDRPARTSRVRPVRVIPIRVRPVSVR
ncbi:hypothetical protein BU197_14905 [Streptomyces sp. CBMA291]|nr:hypothetical protein [Streptomyces sp. CBMA291]MBD0714347.1 hypothetical protein [Streptomyces sp. CBMA370]